MTHALDELDSAGVQTIRLDATPVGRPLYESLGLVAENTIVRHLGVIPPADGPPTRGERPPSEVLEGVHVLDVRATGTERGRLLRRLVDEHPDSIQVVVEAGEVSGFSGPEKG
jgi:hypothetical protein